MMVFARYVLVTNILILRLGIKAVLLVILLIVWSALLDHRAPNAVGHILL